MKQIFLLLMSVILLSACMPTPTVIPPTPTETNTVAPPTITKTVTPTKTATKVPPTVTKTATATITKTATATKPPTITPTRPTPSGDVYWYGDAETGDKSQWCKQTSQTPDRVQVVTDPVRQGKYAYRFELKANDSPSGERSTLANGQCGSGNKYDVNGDERYYGFSVLLPADYPSYSQWSLVWQNKGYHTGSPPAQLGIKNNTWQITVRPNFGSNTVIWKDDTNIKRDVWHDWVFHIKHSTDPKVGFIEAWHNGELVLPKYYYATIHTSGGEPQPSFSAIGLYRDSSINLDVVLYHDGFTVGDSYEAVAP